MNLSKNNDYVKQTEVRLYAYKDLKAKIYNDMLDLNDLKREKRLKIKGHNIQKC